MMISILIADDSPHDLKLITDEIQSCLAKKELTSDIKSVNSLNPDDFNHNYDIAVLDIELGEVSGFVIAEQISRKNPDTVIIFCTSHDDLVFQSFLYNTFYFVRKDSLHEDMENALEKFLLKKSIISGSYTTNRGIEIPITRIQYFEIGGNNIFIYTDIQDQYYTDHISMSRLLEKLPAEMFIQPSQSHLINLAFVKNISEKTVTMKNGQIFSIARRRNAECVSRYMKWLMK